MRCCQFKQGGWAMRVTRRDFLVTSATASVFGAPFFGAPLVRAQTARDSLVVAYPFDIPSWDAVAYTIPLAMPIFASVFDQPLTYSPELKLTPNVIKTWKW